MVGLSEDGKMAVAKARQARNGGKRLAPRTSVDFSVHVYSLFQLYVCCTAVFVTGCCMHCTQLVIKCCVIMLLFAIRTGGSQEEVMHFRGGHGFDNRLERRAPGKGQLHVLLAHAC